MLGEMIGETNGKITVNRVLSLEWQAPPKIESSFQENGNILGIDITGIGTYWSVVRDDSALYGEGQGIIMTNDKEMATWIGRGIGKFTGLATSWRGSLFYQTSSKKLEHLNNIAVVFEYDVDENGNTHSKLWEWK